MRPFYWRNGTSRAVPWNEWKLVRIHEKPFELYNLRDDPAEPKNIVARLSEIMRDLLERWQSWELEVDVNQETK